MAQLLSTRNKNTSLSTPEAILQGLAEDGGLFACSSFPHFPDLDAWKDLDYPSLAQEVLALYMPEYSKETIRNCVQAAYTDSFDTKQIVPLSACGSVYYGELWHGPTCAFKDLALTLLPHLMSAAYEMCARQDLLYILTATSGDTGKAALSGFANVPHTAITVFYPEVGVSPIQKQQMQTSKGDNVSVVALQGNFDDCQRLVKQFSSDPSVKEACHCVSLTSANSINIGRLLPQIVYYVSSYLKLYQSGKIQKGDLVDFCVPTGNFGDILAGYYAKQSGLPIGNLICASNSNHVLTDFFQTGTYSIHRPFLTTMSPSMDILVSSNLERLLFHASSQDDVFVKSCMDQLSKDGSFTIPSHMLAELQSTFQADWCSEEDCRKEMHRVYQESKQLIDPHTAVASVVAQKHLSDHPMVVLSTASPYKFPKDVYESLFEETGLSDWDALEKLHEKTGVPIPKNIASLPSLPIRFHDSILPSQGKQYLLKKLEELQHD